MRTRAASATYFDPAAGGQSAAWTVSPGANTVTLDPDQIYVRQREPQNTTDYASALKRLTLPPTGPWRVSFEVRCGDLGSCATAVGLFNGANLIGWVGADSYYKVLGSFFGKDFFTKVQAGVFPLADAGWHQFEFRSDGRQVSLWRDGIEVACQVTRVRPDRIRIGEINQLFGEPAPALQQTELWVRSVRAD